MVILGIVCAVLFVWCCALSAAIVRVKESVDDLQCDVESAVSDREHVWRRVGQLLDKVARMDKDSQKEAT